MSLWKFLPQHNPWYKMTGLQDLSPERAKSFVEDLTQLGDNILFSAAIPYQGGLGHVNEQYLSYWKKFFNELGFSLCDCVRPIIWNDENIPWHYRQNTVLFTKNSNMQKENMVIDMIHPKFWVNIPDEFPSAIR